MDEKDFEVMEEKVTKELIDLIQEKVDDTFGSELGQVQPTQSTVRAMAKAAAQVLVAFERGYQMTEMNEAE